MSLLQTLVMEADNITIEEKKKLLIEKAKLQGELSLVKDIVSFGGYSVVLVKSDLNGEVPLNFKACQNSANDEFHRNLASLTAMSIQTEIESRLQVLESMGV